VERKGQFLPCLVLHNIKGVMGCGEGTKDCGSAPPVKKRLLGLETFPEKVFVRSGREGFEEKGPKSVHSPNAAGSSQKSERKKKRRPRSVSNRTVL